MITLRKIDGHMSLSVVMDTFNTNMKMIEDQLNAQEYAVFAMKESMRSTLEMAEFVMKNYPDIAQEYFISQAAKSRILGEHTMVEGGSV